VYVGTGDGRLYALNATGSVAWIFDAGGTMGDIWYAGPALALDGTIYIGSTDGFLYAVHGDGTPKWAFRTDGQVLSTPGIGMDGKVYIASAKGRVYGLNPDGPNYNRKIWEYPLGAPITLAASPALGPDGVLYIAAPNGLHALSDH
jgi:outer membrane protein assembly factor BamB